MNANVLLDGDSTDLLDQHQMELPKFSSAILSFLKTILIPSIPVINRTDNNKLIIAKF